MVSQVLGLQLRVERNSLRLVALRTGERLLTPPEAHKPAARGKRK